LLEKAQLIQLEACLPDFWWKFAVAAVANIYLIYTITYLSHVSSGKHLRKSSWITNSKNYTSISLAVEPMCSSLVKFIPTNLYYILN